MKTVQSVFTGVLLGFEGFELRRNSVDQSTTAQPLKTSSHTSIHHDVSVLSIYLDKTQHLIILKRLTNYLERAQAIEKAEGHNGAQS